MASLDSLSLSLCLGPWLTFIIPGVIQQSVKKRFNRLDMLRQNYICHQSNFGSHTAGFGVWGAGFGVGGPGSILGSRTENLKTFV